MGRFLAILLLASAVVWVSPVPAGNPEVPERYISVDEAKALLDRQRRIIFIDVRERPHYDDLHIKGAVNIPLNVLPARLAEVSRTDVLVLY